MNDQERALLKDLRGPSTQTALDAKRYVSETAFRANIDAADKANGTAIGPQLRAIAFGEKAPAAPATSAATTEAELASVIVKYPREKCIELFRRDSRTPGQSSSSLAPADYKEARMAAQFFGIVGGAPNAVKFNYETKRDRDVKRAAVAAEKAKQESTLGENGLPPGIERAKDGIGFVTSDPAAYQAWKDANTAKAVIARALEEVDA